MFWAFFYQLFLIIRNTLCKNILYQCCMILIIKWLCYFILKISYSYIHNSTLQVYWLFYSQPVYWYIKVVHFLKLHLSSRTNSAARYLLGTHVWHPQSWCTQVHTCTEWTIDRNNAGILITVMTLHTLDLLPILGMLSKFRHKNDIESHHLVIQSCNHLDDFQL